MTQATVTIRQTSLLHVARLLHDITNDRYVTDPRLDQIARQIMMDLDPTNATKFMNIYEPIKEPTP